MLVKNKQKKTRSQILQKLKKNIYKKKTRVNNNKEQIGEIHTNKIDRYKNKHIKTIQKYKYKKNNN